MDTNFAGCISLQMLDSGPVVSTSRVCALRLSMTSGYQRRFEVSSSGLALYLGVLGKALVGSEGTVCVLDITILKHAE